MHASPALFVERETDGIDDWILSADVEIAALGDVAERSPKDHVLEILRIGNEGHDALRSSGSILMRSPWYTAIDAKRSSTASDQVGSSAAGAGLRPMVISSKRRSPRR